MEIIHIVPFVPELLLLVYWLLFAQLLKPLKIDTRHIWLPSVEAAERRKYSAT